MAIGAVLGLQTVNGGTILWIVALVIGVSLLLERPRVRDSEHADSR